MKKYYYEDLNPTYSDIDTYCKTLFNFDGEDENGCYWLDKEQFEWWQNIKTEMENGTFTNLEDYC